MDIQAYLSNLSDEKLLAETEQAYKDMKDAAEDQPQSERHQECFAGFFCLAQEVARRGLKTVTIH